ncbi:hypothetical protein ACOBQX_00820 [Actinokineospora sp. G85]|uniref:hypothetical protein n=1 Tax=Actinokineospora sp. G85 TaxID=3406626 RepID=UPI003C763578
MRRTSGRVFATVLFGLTMAMTAAAGPAVAEIQTGSPSELGLSFTPDGNAGQCVGTRSQWTPSPDWTNKVLIDTDSRSGGCLLAFGVRDLAGNLPGLALSYRWEASPGANAGQCGNQGLFPLPVTPQQTLGSTIKVDTDSRQGYCDLTFFLSGRTDVALDVRFWPETVAGKDQCVNSLPQDEWHSVRPDAPITIGMDTDSRQGGCYFSLRLRQF